jgi:SAM-dependent methyltransferase
MDRLETRKSAFPGLTLDVEDLFLLEGFQIGDLRHYVPRYLQEEDLAAVLWAYPPIQRFLVKKHPPIADFVERIVARYEPVTDPEELAEHADRAVWGISDLLAYDKAPEVHAALASHNWDFHEVVTSVTALDGKVVLDVGAGTGRVALEAAQTAAQVFAVEPVTRLREFIRERVSKAGLKNVYVVDGFLHQIPLPDGYGDVLLTSQAIGWHLLDELPECERVVKGGGFIIHRLGADVGEGVTTGDEDLHAVLTSPAWGYEAVRYKETGRWKVKYWKQV